MRSGANLAAVKDETVSLPFFKEAAGRGSLVKQQEIYCYHKRKSKEIVCMQEWPTGGYQNPPSSTASPGTSTNRYLR